MQELMQDQKDFLRKCNPRFFEREVDLISGRFVRVDACRLYIPSGVTHAMDLARRIICPGDCVPDVQSLLKQYNVNLHIAALEELPLHAPTPHGPGTS